MKGIPGVTRESTFSAAIFFLKYRPNMGKSGHKKMRIDTHVQTLILTT